MTFWKWTQTQMLDLKVIRLNKRSLTKTILGFAASSGYKCNLLLQTLLCKLSTQQCGLPLKRQNPKTLATCDPIKSLLSLSCDSKPRQSNVIILIKYF